jgi:hypothetical protein
MRPQVRGLENVPSAQKCDCGYSFADGIQMVPGTQSPKPSNRAFRSVWLLPFLGAITAGAEMYLNWDMAKSAPQQAALAGIALAWVVIAYCFARAVMGLAGKS